MSLFITFEGLDGSGKSTQARRLYQRLEANGYPVILTREPGGTPISDRIRHIVLDLQQGEVDPTTEVLLFAAARAQHVAERIRPQLQCGGIVVCDRFADSTYAYQGYGLGCDLEELRTITQIATRGLRPDVTVYLDLPVVEGIERKRMAAVRSHDNTPPTSSGLGAGGSALPPEWNRLDAREAAFHERVHAGYRALIAAEPERWLCFDGHLDQDTLARMIGQKNEPYLPSRR